MVSVYCGSYLKLVMMYKMVHRQVHIDNGTQQQAKHEVTINDFCSHTPELILTFTLITPLQLNYGITYLVVLWNHLP